MNVFGEALRGIREDRRLKQTEFARMVGIPPVGLGQIERGQVRSGSKQIQQILEHDFTESEIKKLKSTFKKMEAYDQKKAEARRTGPRYDKTVYQLQRGGEILATGTIMQIAKKIKVKPETVASYKYSKFADNPNVRRLVDPSKVEEFVIDYNVDYDKLFGDTLKEIRAERGYSIADMAVKVGLIVRTYSRVESGLVGMNSKAVKKIRTSDIFTPSERNRLIEAIKTMGNVRNKTAIKVDAKRDKYRIPNIPGFYDELNALGDLSDYDYNDPAIRAIRRKLGGPDFVDEEGKKAPKQTPLSKGQKMSVTATISKVRANVPTVLEISGKRYVLDYRGKNK